MTIKKIKRNKSSISYEIRHIIRVPVPEPELSKLNKNHNLLHALNHLYMELLHGNTDYRSEKTSVLIERILNYLV